VGRTLDFPLYLSSLMRTVGRTLEFPFYLFFLDVDSVYLAALVGEPGDRPLGVQGLVVSKQVHQLAQGRVQYIQLKVTSFTSLF
jgi:hypothetical protein